MFKHLFKPLPFCSCAVMAICLFGLGTGLMAQIKPGLSSDSQYRKYADTSKNGFIKTRPYYLGYIKAADATGLNLVRQLNDSISIIEITSADQYESLLKLSPLLAVNDNWKLSPALERAMGREKHLIQKFILTGLDVQKLVALLTRSHPNVTILHVDRPSRSVVAKTTAAYVAEVLLGLNEIIFVDAAVTAHAETRLIGYDRSLHGINAVDYLVPGANGKNIVAGVKEQRMDELDIDLWKRVRPSPIAAAIKSYHATVIATIIGGAGNSFYDGRGIAWGCLFFPSTFDNLFADDAMVLSSNNVSVQNHSYGTIIQQFYGAEAVSYDLLTSLNKNLLIVMSAGNQGEAAASEGRYANLPGFANLTGNFKMAKNIVTVGAIDQQENVPAQSSAGPLYDGRLGPQLAALGPNGTSDAAAIISGTAAVLQQVYRDSNGVLPPAALTKAILYNTAEDIYPPGIDYKTGYGLVDSYGALRSMQQKQYDGGRLTNGEVWTKTIVVPPNAAALKVTLAWTDTAAQVNNNKALINDLDLELVQTNGGAVFFPWVLSLAAHRDSLAKAPVRRRDSLNTAEQVEIRLPAPGSYQVRVRGSAVSNAPIAFHIASKIDTLNTFTFTSPLHASDVVREENENTTIRWKTFVADSLQTGALSITYNNGGSWQLLGRPRLIAKKFVWPVKDTNAVARLKMETPFGNFLSTEFFIGQLTKLNVDFNCADSFGLSWNKQPLANAYRLYTLTDSPYLKPILVLADTFVVLRRATNPSLVYAVEPVLTAAVPAARSVAIDISLQAVNCFYRALNYNLLDENTLKLILELSVTRYADSIFFEKVTASGQLLQVYGAAKVIANNLTYTQVVDDLPAGISYVRARIKLTNGAVLYTDIIPVLTSGPQFIYFYPNPAPRNTILNYSLRQGIPTSSKLQLIDAAGRLLIEYTSMPGKVDVARLMPGVVFYRLLTAENRVLETGKIIIL